MYSRCLRSKRKTIKKTHKYKSRLLPMEPVFVPHILCICCLWVWISVLFVENAFDSLLSVEFVDAVKEKHQRLSTCFQIPDHFVVIFDIDQDVFTSDEDITVESGCGVDEKRDRHRRTSPASVNLSANHIPNSLLFGGTLLRRRTNQQVAKKRFLIRKV